MIHLHTHTEFSLLDGLPTAEDLIKRASQLGQPALAITDHGNMFGVPFFVKTAKAYNVKPIIGIETYLVDDMADRMRRRSYHFLLIAYNEEGYKTLIKLSSDAFLDGYYYRPRIDWDYLNANNSGLIATTGCLAAPVPQNLLTGNDELAQKYLEYSYDIFGQNRLFIELQLHEGIPELEKINETMLSMGKKFGLKSVATNDIHYALREDAKLHDILLCIQTKKTVKDTNRMRFSGNDYYLKSEQEMLAIFPKNSIDNTVLISEMCTEFELFDSSPKLPKIADDSDAVLAQIAMNGLLSKYGILRASSDQEVVDRFNHELKIISEMGFSDYFLIIADLCKFAKNNNIWWI